MSWKGKPSMSPPGGKVPPDPRCHWPDQAVRASARRGDAGGSLVSRTDSIESAASTQYAGDDDLDAKSPGTTISTPDDQAEEPPTAKPRARTTTRRWRPAGRRPLRPPRPPPAAEDETINIDDEASASALTLLALGSMGGWGHSPVATRLPSPPPTSRAAPAGRRWPRSRHLRRL